MCIRDRQNTHPLTQKYRILTYSLRTEWPKISENTALYDFVTVDLTPLNVTYFLLLITSHDVICSLQVSIMVCVKETKQSLVTCLRKCGVRPLRNEFRNKHWYLASISRLLKQIDNDEICDRKCDSRHRSSRTSGIVE